MKRRIFSYTISIKKQLTSLYSVGSKREQFTVKVLISSHSHSMRKNKPAFSPVKAAYNFMFGETVFVFF